MNKTDIASMVAALKRVPISDANRPELEKLITEANKAREIYEAAAHSAVIAYDNFLLAVRKIAAFGQIQDNDLKQLHHSGKSVLKLQRR